MTITTASAFRNRRLSRVGRERRRGRKTIRCREHARSERMEIGNCAGVTVIPVSAAEGPPRRAARARLARPRQADAHAVTRQPPTPSCPALRRASTPCGGGQRPSLRGAKRRSHPAFWPARRLDGFAPLAMTITTAYRRPVPVLPSLAPGARAVRRRPSSVIARSEATKQSRVLACATAGLLRSARNDHHDRVGVPKPAFVACRQRAPSRAKDDQVSRTRA
jgi:hypothetical protein